MLRSALAIAEAGGKGHSLPLSSPKVFGSVVNFSGHREAVLQRGHNPLLVIAVCTTPEAPEPGGGAVARAPSSLSSAVVNTQKAGLAKTAEPGHRKCCNFAKQSVEEKLY